MKILVSLRCVLLSVCLIVLAGAEPARPEVVPETQFRHIPLEYIVALGDPGASSGDGAASWGLWHEDPGPRGCMLKDYEKLKASGGIAPAQWKYDDKDWWLEEHGLIMEKPIFPLPSGQYVVTGGRGTTAVLTVFPMNKAGEVRWQLDGGVKLYDVTHLPCHAARYTPAKGDAACSPSMVQDVAFPVGPGVPMPAVNGCNKQEYSVLFVIGVSVKNK
ncbi:MAG: hypothetical protein HQL17_00955 [Candidatus Omnitrophica bacterium]|nr:hypothetical protein [Candidatus Omnitrophota bacterium]